MARTNDYLFAYFGEEGKCTYYIYSSNNRRGTDANRRDCSNAIYLATGKHIAIHEWYSLNNTFTLKEMTFSYLDNLTSQIHVDGRDDKMVDCRVWQ